MIVPHVPGADKEFYTILLMNLDTGLVVISYPCSSATEELLCMMFYEDLIAFCSELPL